MKKTALALALFSSAAALAPAIRTTGAPSAVPAIQEDGEQEEEEEDDPGGLLGVIMRQRRALTEGLPGTWRLTRFEHSFNQTDQAPVFGFMSIEKGGFLSLVVHARDPQAGFFDGGLRVQGGVHHWRLTDDGLLQTASVLAHSNFSGDLGVETVFTPREYDPTLDGNFLTLRRPDDSLLHFERVVDPIFPAEAARRIDAGRNGRSIYEGF